MIKKHWLVALIVLVMGGGGIAHLLATDQFTSFVFAPFPSILTVIVTGLLQIGIAVLVLIPSWRGLAGLLFAGLCLCYMPLHIWDLFRDDPVISPLSVAVVRIFLQIFFIWAGLRLWRRHEG